MALVSYTTTRGCACKLTAAESGGWRDTTGAFISAYPSHGNWYYALVLNIVGVADLRDVWVSNLAGLTLTPQANGYTVLAKPRNNTNFPVSQDNVARQGTCTCPQADWLASGSGIQARYLAKCDENPYVTVANIADLFDLNGLQTANAGAHFTVPNVATFSKA